MSERIICEFCGVDILKRTRNKHYKTKKCTKARLTPKQACPGCNQKFSKEEYEGHIKTCFSYNQILVLKKENDKLRNIINKKDEFIQNLASRPSTSTSTTHNNNFNMNQYFEGNKGIDFLDDESLMNKRVEYCRLMMEDTIEKHGLNPKMIAETKQEQCKYLFKDETTGKWNVINTDSSRNTFSICKRAQDDRTLYVKDPKGKMLKLTIDKVDVHNRTMIYKLSLDQDEDTTLDEKFECYNICLTINTDKLMSRVPVKSMI